MFVFPTQNYCSWFKLIKITAGMRKVITVVKLCLFTISSISVITLHIISMRKLTVHDSLRSVFMQGYGVSGGGWEEHETGKGLALKELFDLALTALAFLAFGLFIINLIMTCFAVRYQGIITFQNKGKTVVL